MCGSATRFLLVACGLLAGLLLIGCQWDVGTVDVRLVYSPTENLNPLSQSAGVARVRVRVEGESISPRETEFAVGSRAGRLPDLPVGERVRVIVEGVDSIGLTVSRGASSVFETKSGKNRIYLFIGRRESFSDPPAFPVGDQNWPERYRSGFAESGGRVFHRAASLTDDSVLVVGGSSGVTGNDYLARLNGDQVLTSAERFDPTAGAFLVSSEMTMASGRAHAALADFPGLDAMLVFCGDPIGAMAETFDLESGTFATTSTALDVPRSRTAWTPLFDPGQGLVVAGGIGETGELLSSVEFLDPQTRSFSRLTSELSAARSGARAVAYDGGVLVIGGWEEFPPWPSDSPPVRLASTRVDRLVRSGGTWQVSHLADLNSARAEHSAVLVEVMRRDELGQLVLEDGEPVVIPAVMVCGGLRDAIQANGDCELIDPQSGTIWTDETLFSILGERWRHTATVLSDGRVLVAGGFQGGGSAPGAHNMAVIVDPDREKPVKRITMAARRGGHTATVLVNGMVLLVGGMANGQDMADTDYEIFVP